MSESVTKNIYITDLNTDLTFLGEVKSFEKKDENVTVLLNNVTVYEYSSSNFLYSQPEISLSGPASRFHIEDAV
ncbi:hypothetical protein [Mucilaginibacter rubeus]|uniref:Uncharacterized protein n=1 Tax=Mucilaginibacter rubeus TaxID=2027860 RepID=A0A5C1I0V7_9SPHI|nr:hypothetical protein [Mucilaginibacter rubeus]QEM10888.1 hypothetical protein DEO27_012935 [Mucilaginibacter rubeus]